MTTTKKIKKWFDFDHIKEMQINKWFDFEWLKKTELVELHEVDISKDPVRPELDLKFRTSYGRKIYGLKHGEDIMAVMCFAFVNEIPKNVNDLDVFSKDAYLQATMREGIQGSIAIAYTVWSLKKGGGKMIVKEVYNMIKESNHLNRLITLSPLTKMAEKFHLRNGAKLIQKNETTQNFEYEVIK
jgi:predicted CoA-binding protein